ncbi:unnamed protein product [Vitrella brassicaformis CCMP3155]|uniref:Uncharacterized protein n=1 Tax=Vitrella brassicaformis (strain CCMP3155) TaxID=1169540 RepID=A0A0G4G5G6_VITBC|nr:unnamed protein product [Vitrella brassicaformis CCMP3155]|eukprot:CEM23480.1 unnamed protein product [Vitrella brassicaformis CCMP3155]
MTLFGAVAGLHGWLHAVWLHWRRRRVQWYVLGSRRFRTIERDELLLLRLVPFVGTNPLTDPPISEGFSDNRLYPTFSGFILDALLQLDHVRSRMRVALDITVRRCCPCWDAPDPHLVIINFAQGVMGRVLPEALGYGDVCVMVLSLNGGSVVAAMSVIHQRIVVRTTEAEVAGWVTDDERFPMTMARVRQLLRRLGVGDV